MSHAGCDLTHGHAEGSGQPSSQKRESGHSAVEGVTEGWVRSPTLSMLHHSLPPPSPKLRAQGTNVTRGNEEAG